MPCKHSDADLKQAFDSIDADKSGAIDRKEMKNCLVKLGMPDADADAIAGDVMKDDPNNDGKITFKEFMAVMKK